MRISKVYTRTGDGGETRLGGGQKTSKDSARIESFGTVDELGSFLGVVLTAGVSGDLVKVIRRLQNDLFHMGSDLCLLAEDKKKHPIPQIEKRHVDGLEAEIDRLQEHLKPLEEFILPGGTAAAAHLHVARCVCRRAERLVVHLAQGEEVGPYVVSYLNRLSDLLFVMARYENLKKGVQDPQWDKSL